MICFVFQLLEIIFLYSQQPIYQVYAKKISAFIYRATKKPILLAIALKDKEPLSIPSISELVMKNDVWS